MLLVAHCDTQGPTPERPERRSVHLFAHPELARKHYDVSTSNYPLGDAAGRCLEKPNRIATFGRLTPAPFVAAVAGVLGGALVGELVEDLIIQRDWGILGGILGGSAWLLLEVAVARSLPVGRAFGRGLRRALGTAGSRPSGDETPSVGATLAAGAVGFSIFLVAWGLWHAVLDAEYPIFLPLASLAFLQISFIGGSSLIAISTGAASIAFRALVILILVDMAVVAVMWAWAGLDPAYDADLRAVAWSLGFAAVLLPNARIQLLWEPVAVAWNSYGGGVVHRGEGRPARILMKVAVGSSVVLGLYGIATGDVASGLVVLVLGPLVLGVMGFLIGLVLEGALRTPLADAQARMVQDPGSR